MLTGTVVGSGVASSPDRAMVASYTMVVPAKTTANLAEMAKEGLRWREQVKSLYAQVPRPVADRARFAEETLALATDNLRMGIPTTIVAQAQNDRILGVILFDTLMSGPRVGSGVLKLLAIEPVLLAGTPGKQQLRGIGTALTAATSRQFLAKGVSTVVISPLDEEAKRFWIGRGAELCGESTLLCVTGRDKVERLIGNCEITPCSPADGDCVLCGAPGATDGYRLPGVRR